MQHHLSVDIETYSDQDIGSVGVFKYVDTPAFEILLFAYAYDFGEVKVVDLAQGETIPEQVVRDLADPEVIKHAYNAAFEITCLNHAGYKTPAEQWRCTMVHGLYLGYPAGLARLGQVLGLPEDKQKMKVGKALIKYFCGPCAPTRTNGGRTRNMPYGDEEKWKLFVEYNRQDVVTEMEDYQRLKAFPVPDEVQQDWVIDYYLNLRGIQVDRELVAGALKINAKNRERLLARSRELTGLANPASRAQLLAWLKEQGTDLPDLTKDTVKEALKTSTGTVRKVLDIQSRIAKASLAKYEAMDRATCSDGRIRGTLLYYGARRTGRWAGRILQTQNLPHDVPVAIDTARALVKRGSLEELQLLYGRVSNILSQLIRSALVAKPEHVFVVADFSAIEARVLAWLAGEDWRQKVFKDGGDIYCASASAMFKVPVVKHGINGHLRQKGKIAELALGYGGGANALITMGALKMGLTEDELPEIVSKWREANPNIKRYWYKAEQAALDAMSKAVAQDFGHGMSFAREANLRYGYDYLTCKLPSGRKLFYPQPMIGSNRFGGQEIRFKTWSGIRWIYNGTYSGKLVENITQAVARDCLATAIRRLVAHGYKPLMHIHDEVVLEVPVSQLHDDELDRVVAIMCAPIDWAPGLLLNADGFVSPYYKKD
ncbi:DNA polymerase [uncultured Acidaminococcus sp.]|uniref:DNA polymerase n=1 Tax=uncultured Acidaminococcus sp. TaxID=352152 RepID=UPI0026DCF216|nr:DNA polymerase [uncultured Acidaminococcus sp.]